jgi:hypothetical protein
MEDKMLSKKNVGLIFVFIISMVYAILSYLISQNEVSGLINRYIAPLLLLIPTPGIIAFLYGCWSRDARLSVLIGFLPVFIFFISSEFFETYTLILGEFLRSLFLALFMGVVAGLMGYGGAMNKKEKKEWIALVSAGIVLWISRILAGMR